MNTIPLSTFNELEPARQLRDRLQTAGVEAVIHDETKLERYWFMSEPLAAIHVEVREFEYLAARGLIEDWDRADGVLKSAVHCPECKSPRVEYPQMSRKFATPALVGLLMLVRVLPREYYCLDCQFTWPKEQPPEIERDILLWPANSKFWHPERFAQSKGRQPGAGWRFWRRFAGKRV